MYSCRCWHNPLVSEPFSIHRVLVELVELQSGLVLEALCYLRQVHSIKKFPPLVEHIWFVVLLRKARHQVVVHIVYPPCLSSLLQCVHAENTVTM